MQQLAKISHSLQQLIREVGLFIKSELGQVQHGAIEVKSLNSLVSYVDKTAEQQLVAGCQQILPEAGFITEEDSIENTEGQAPWRWIIDPLDGTTNFLHQLPFFSISVALQKDNATVLGMVYEVNREELFHAFKGNGCYLNEQPIQVTKTDGLAHTLLATGFPYYDFERQAAYLQVLAKLMNNSRGLRRLGSAALDLAYTAAGRFDGFFEYSLAPWDVAAGAFLVQEAGGIVSDFAGGNNYLFGKEMLAANTAIHAKMLQIIQEKQL